MKKSHTENTVGPWAEQKLDALESYLNAYHLVMKKQRFKLIYIDAFAGADWYRVRSGDSDDAALDLLLDDDQVVAEEKFIAGSPVRALRTGRGFDQYYFFDTDHRRATLLNGLKRTYPGRTIHVEVGDANKWIQKLARRFLVSPDARGVAFLDPYGPHLHWKTVRALSETRKVDVIINFPLAMAINRLIARKTEIPKNQVRLLDECFGTHAWYDLAHEGKTDLFGTEVIRKSEATVERLLAFYHGRLKDVFGHVVLPSLVTNTKGAPLYYLMWAGSNSRGSRIADHIMKLGKRVKPSRHQTPA